MVGTHRHRWRDNPDGTFTCLNCGITIKQQSNSKINIRERLAVGQAVEDLPPTFRKADVLKLTGRVEHNIHGQTVFRTLDALRRAGMLEKPHLDSNIFIKTEKYGPAWKEAILL